MATATRRTRGRRSVTPSEPHDPNTLDDEFLHALERVTGRVGRALAVGIPSLFLFGLILLPLGRLFSGGIPSALALLIVILGAAGMVVAYELLRTNERRSTSGRRGLSGLAKLAIIGVLAFIVLYLVVFVITGQSQTAAIGAPFGTA